MAGPDAGTRPRKKRTLTRKKGEARYKGGTGIPSVLKKTAKLQTGGYHREVYKKGKGAVKRAGSAVKAVASNPKGEWKETKKVAKNLLKKKPITHMAKKEKGWFS